VVTAGECRIVESFEQMTLPAAEVIAAGAPVRIDTSGLFTNANGTTATEADVYGVATRSVRAREAVTAVRKGVLDGFNLTGAYWSSVYAADTDGRLGDVAGTVSRVLGRVIPGTATPVGTAYDKLLLVDVQ
jgi:hypothetical protein